MHLKYEEMMIDFDNWRMKLTNYLDIKISPMDIEKIKILGKIGQVSKENINSHIRQAKPGDYKRKLKKETIR